MQNPCFGTKINALIGLLPMETNILGDDVEQTFIYPSDLLST
jgi:hypothetical protein